MFNQYFVGQANVKEPDKDIISLSVNSNVSTLSSIRTSVTEVQNLIAVLDTSKACGHDGIGNRIIKMCVPGVLKPLLALLNFSLQLGEFPKEWKKSNVIPLFKKGDRQDKTNYRPVSLLPSLSKILEKVVFVRLYNFLLHINYLNPLQSGFRPGDSTVNQLLYIVHLIYEAFENGKEVRMFFLDISKAFDRVWHKGLIHKLEVVGVKDQLNFKMVPYLSLR